MENDAELLIYTYATSRFANDKNWCGSFERYARLHPKSPAQVTNLIAGPDASADNLADAVDNMPYGCSA
jgi:hypothetical protein